MLRGQLHGIIDVIPVGIFAVGVGAGGIGRIARELQRQPPVGVGHGQPLELRQRHALHGVEPLPRALLEIVRHLLAIQAVEDLPRRVAQIEERLPVLPNQISARNRQFTHTLVPLVFLCKYSFLMKFPRSAS